MPYAFLHGGNIEQTAVRVLASHGCHSVVGPHGTGKSTFVRSLANALEQELDSRVILLQLKSGGHANRALKVSWKTWPAHGAVIIDGFEQIRLWNRWLAIAFCRKHLLPLVVTSHKKMRGCTILWETKIDRQTEQWVLSQLLAKHSPSVVDRILQSEAWRSSRIRHKDNLRESLFDMYDWWQTNEAHLC